MWIIALLQIWNIYLLNLVRLMLFYHSVLVEWWLITQYSHRKPSLVQLKIYSISFELKFTRPVFNLINRQRWCKIIDSDIFFTTLNHRNYTVQYFHMDCENHRLKCTQMTNTHSFMVELKQHYVCWLTHCVRSISLCFFPTTRQPLGIKNLCVHKTLASCWQFLSCMCSAVSVVLSKYSITSHFNCWWLKYILIDGLVRCIKHIHTVCVLTSFIHLELCPAW